MKGRWKITINDYIWHCNEKSYLYLPCLLKVKIASGKILKEKQPYHGTLAIFSFFAALMSLLPRLVWAEETFLRKDDKNDNKLSIYFCDTMARTKLGFKLPENRDGARNHVYKFFLLILTWCSCTQKQFKNIRSKYFLLTTKTLIASV